MREVNIKANITKSDIILIASVIVVCAALAVFPYMFREKGEAIYIYKDGVLFAEKSLSENSVTDVGGLMSVVIEDGTVRVADSVCPNGDCMKTTASSGGDMIICLPNRILIEITGMGETDAVSG